jgi:DNA polymerase-1
MVLKQHFGVDVDPLMDTILLHRSVESELPHKLGYVGSVYTDVTAWKDAHTAAVASTDEELGTYCAIDCVVTARSLPKLADAVKLRSQGHVVAFDHKVQEVCVGIHRVGMLVDMKRRHEEAGRLTTEMTQWSAETRRCAGKPDMNLNSTPQLRTLLFKDWRLTPAAYTKLGDPSTNDESLRLIRTQNRDNPQVTEFIDSLRRFRRASKEYGTYVKRMVPYGQPIDGLSFRDEDEEEEAARGLIMSDGRVRPDYNAHGTTSGRLSSSNPNAQNWPKHLRAMIVPAPGNVIVGADADQLELRIIAAVAQIDLYLDVFTKGGDPHAMTASLMFGRNFDSLEPKSEQWDKLRKIAKSIKYASFYGSGDETVHNLVTSAEDAKGNLMYPDLTLREIATLRRRWLSGIPQLPRWWESALDEYRSNGFVLDPVVGRRRDFLDGENMNEIVNFPIQSAGAHIIHLSTFDLIKDIPFEKWGPGTGLIAQVHDALYVECPESEASWVADCIKHHMNRVVPGLPGVAFSAKPKAGRNWGEV